MSVGKDGLEVGEDLRGRLACGHGRQARRQLGWRAASVQGRADLALSVVEASPDALPGPLTQPASNGVAGSENAAGDNALEEPPQRGGGEAEPSDFVGAPDAESPPATAACLAVAAKDPPRAHGPSLRAALVESVQEAMPDQRAYHLAVRARRLLEPFGAHRPFVFAAAKPALVTHGTRLLENRDSSDNGEARGTAPIKSPPIRLTTSAGRPRRPTRTAM